VFIHVVNFLSNSNVRIGSSKLPVFKSRIEENAFLEELEFWKIDYKQDCILIIIKLNQTCRSTQIG